MCTRMTQKCDMENEQVCQQVPVRVPVERRRSACSVCWLRIDTVTVSMNTTMSNAMLAGPPVCSII